MLFCKEIVIGNNLEAMYFSWLREIPILINDSHDYFTFDWLTPFHSKIDDYEKMFLSLSLLGLNPYGLEIKSIYFLSENEIELSFKNIVKKVQIHFEKCHIFSEQNVVGATFEENPEEQVYRCVDFFDCRRFSGLETDLYFVTGERFPATITFQSLSELTDYKMLGSQQSIPIKHHTTSYFTKKEFEQKDETRKFLVMKNARKFLEKNGYKSLKMEYGDRYIVPSKMINHKNSETIQFHYESLENILKEVQEEYSKKFLKKSKKCTILEGLTSKFYVGKAKQNIPGESLQKLD